MMTDKPCPLWRGFLCIKKKGDPEAAINTRLYRGRVMAGFSCTKKGDLPAPVLGD
jgi:hypothetical protein